MRLGVWLLLLTGLTWAQPDEVRLRVYQVESPNQVYITGTVHVRAVKEPGEPLPSASNILQEVLPKPYGPEEVVWHRQGDQYVSEKAQPLAVEEVQALRDALLTPVDLKKMLVALGMTPERIETLRAELRTRLGSAPTPEDLYSAVLRKFQPEREHVLSTQILLTLPGLTARAASETFGAPLAVPWLIPDLAPNYNPAICAAVSPLVGKVRGFYPFLEPQLQFGDWEDLWVKECPQALARLVQARPGWDRARDRFSTEPATNLSLRPYRGPIDRLACLEVRLRRGLPLGTWQDALDELDAHERAIASQPWLLSWKAARFGRRLETLRGRDERIVVHLLEAEGPFGSGATGFFERDGTFQILSVAGPRTAHWFDQLPPDMMVIIKPDGTREVKQTEELR